LLGTRKHIVQSLGAELPALDLRFVTKSELTRHIRSPVLIAKQNYFHVRTEKGPASQGVALDDAGVVAKRLGGRKKGEHVDKQLP
jgi:hypothetical protein